jgi:SAM-dependent methyltransferase
MLKEFLPNIQYVFSNPFYITRRHLYRNIKELSDHFGTGLLLDIGCGTKPYERMFSKATYKGLDYRKAGANQNPHADILYDGGKFPIKTKMFDYALATEVLEHVFEPDSFVGEIARILKPGGLLLLTVPFIWDEHEQPYDFGRYTSFGIRALLERNGFEILAQRKTGGFIETLGQLFCTYLYYTFSKNRILYKLSLPLIFAPLQLLTILMAKVLPVNQGFYLDNILLCRKK